MLPCLQCTPEQISSDLHDELMFQLDHDDNLQKVSPALLLYSDSTKGQLHFTVMCPK